MKCLNGKFFIFQKFHSCQCTFIIAVTSVIAVLGPTMFDKRNKMCCCCCGFFFFRMKNCIKQWNVYHKFDSIFFCRFNLRKILSNAQNRYNVTIKLFAERRTHCNVLVFPKRTDNFNNRTGNSINIVKWSDQYIHNIRLAGTWCLVTVVSINAISATWMSFLQLDDWETFIFCFIHCLHLW